MKERRSRGGARLISPMKRIILIIMIVVLCAFIVNGIKMHSSKIDEYNEKLVKIENLEKEIEAEDNKLEQINKSHNQITSDEEYESLAREELGLIRKDEIVIRPR